jgi:tRNA(adenine34) deaminase
MPSHEDYMNLCLKLAREAPSNEVPVAAMLVRDGEILSQAINERESRNSILGHAELIALENAAAKTADWNLSNATVYITLEPCAMCAGAILQSHVSTVVFGAYDAKSGAFGSRYQLATKNLKIIGGILEQECSSLLQEFFTNKR